MASLWLSLLTIPMRQMRWAHLSLVHGVGAVHG
jgi:hypothetical protein